MSNIVEQARACRKALDEYVADITEIPQKINEHTAIIRPWKPAVYKVGDVRVADNIPYKCVQAHNSTDNPDWTPANVPALWMQYHGTTPETARPWIQPSGAEDIYRADEYMIWTDGKTYKCKSPTNFDPTQYAQAWEVVE